MNFDLRCLQRSFEGSFADPAGEVSIEVFQFAFSGLLEGGILGLQLCYLQVGLIEVVGDGLPERLHPRGQLIFQSPE